MTWDYELAVNSLDLIDIATFATIENEVPSAFGDVGVSIPGRPGVEYDPAAPFMPLVATLRVHLRWTDEDGAITHTDGAAGHIYENLSLLKAELNKTAPIIYRTIPHAGDLRATFKSVTPGFVGQQRHVYNFPLVIPSGSWQSVTETSETGNPPAVETEGDREVHDPRLSISAAGTTTITGSDGIGYTIVASSGPTYPIVVDVGAGTVIDAAAADARGHVAFSHQNWLRLQPKDTPTISTSVAVTVMWRDRWS